MPFRLLPYCIVIVSGVAGINSLSAAPIKKMPKSELSLDSIPIGSSGNLRLRDDRMLYGATIEKISATTVEVSYERDSLDFSVIFSQPTGPNRGVIDRHKIFRISTNKGYFSDLPLTPDDHRYFESYHSFAVERGDYVVTRDRIKQYGFLESEDYSQISLQTSAGIKTFYRTNLIDCYIKGKSCDSNKTAAVSQQSLNEFAAALEKILPSGSLEKSFGVGSIKNATGDKAADSISRIIKNKTIAHLSKLGIQVHDREQLSSVIKEKELAQQGLLPGKDITFETSRQSAFIISGQIEKAFADKYTLTMTIISTQSLNVVGSREILLELADVNAAPNAQMHSGFHANLTVGPGFSTIAAINIESLDSLSLNGVSGFVQLRAGFAIEENFIIALNLGSNYMNEPVANSSPELLAEKRLSNRAFGLTTWGPSLTYFTERNYFLTGMVGAATAIYADTKQELSVKNGFAALFGLGREWWLNDSFALGISLNVQYSYINLNDMELILKTKTGEIRDTDFSLSQYMIVLAFSASYH